MNIREQFNIIAKEYDSGRKKFIPCFDDFYIKTTDFISANIKQSHRILDLGAGTGLLTMFWYNHFPNSEYLLVDIADEMLTVAKERFKGLDNFKFQNCDYNKNFSFDDYDLIISALSIHHLEHSEKQNLFYNIFNYLPKNGVFVNYDQHCAGNNDFNKWFDNYWENYLLDSELSDKDISLWKERRKLDKECSVEEEIEMLKSAGFNKIKCVYSYQKFSVVVAIK